MVMSPFAVFLFIVDASLQLPYFLSMPLPLHLPLSTTNICFDITRGANTERNNIRPRFNLRAVGVRGFSVAQLPVTLEDIDEVWDQAGIDSASSSGSSTVGDCTISSSGSLRSSGGGKRGGGGAGTIRPEQAALSTAKSTKVNALEKAGVATVEGASLEAPETMMAQVTVTPSTSKASDQSPQGDGKDGGIACGSNDNEEEGDRRSAERVELVGAAAAAKGAAAADCANPEQSGEAVASSEDRREAGSPAPVQEETSVGDKRHTGFEATRTTEEPVSESSNINTMVVVGGIDAGRNGQQKKEEEECEIAEQTDGPLEAESMEKGENEEDAVVEQEDQKDGLVGFAVDAAERVAPTVENDEGSIPHRKPSEGHFGAKVDKNDDVDIAITAAECADESFAAGKPVTTNPSEGVEDTPDPSAVLTFDPDEQAEEYPTELDASNSVLIEGENDDLGESPPPRDNKPSPMLVDDTRTASAASQVDPLTAGEPGQDSAVMQATKNVGDDADLSHSVCLDDEKALEKDAQEREQKVEGQAALGYTPGGVGGKGADGDIVDTSPPEIEAKSVSCDGGVAEDAIDEKNAPLVPSRLWEFPPSFEALVTLSTASEAVECTLEGEIAPALKGESRDNGVPSWKSVHCSFKITPGEGSHPSSRADIDLEDDEAQARLEDLLEREYGLTMEDVLERFSPDTDLGSSDAILRSFTDSICQLRPSLLAQPQSTKGEAGLAGGGDRAVYQAVGTALRGGGEGPEWREMRVRVGESRVLEVSIATNTSGTTVDNRGQSTESGGGNTNSESGTSNNSVVDCSSVASPTALTPHLLSGGVPVSAVDVLERAGFLDARSVVDLADVLAALAQEAGYGKGDLAQSSPAMQESGVERNWPAVDLDRDGTRVLRLLSERRSGSLATMHECTVAITGTSERLKLEVSPVLAGDDVLSASVVVATVSCLQPLGTVIEKGCRSETHRKRETAEDASPRIVDSREADTAGLNVGDRVEARFGGKTEWFPGTVRAINAVGETEAPVGSDGVGDGGGSGRGGTLRSNLPTIAIDYDDGDVEERVPRVRVRLPGQKQPRFLTEGDEVDVKRGKKISLARVVVRPASPPKEGHYDLQLLDDGRRRVGGVGDLVENCPRGALMALHGWPPAGK